jgi:hypothetical protein
LKIFVKKIIPYFLIPIFIFGLEFFINKNSEDGIQTKISKLLNSYKKFDICFYGDSKNLWNFNYETLKKEFPSLTFYNFSLSGFSFDDISTMYNENLCNCKLNIINLNETTQNDNVISSKYGYLFNSLSMFTFLNPLLLKKVYLYKKMTIEDNENIKKGFYNISNVSYLSKNINPNDIEEILNNIFQKYQRLSLKITNSNVVFIIHSDRDFRRKYLYDNFGKEFLLDLHKNYFIGHELIDFRDIEKISNDSLFYDTHHLNKKGSILFTEIFSDSLRNKNSLNKILN